MNICVVNPNFYRSSGVTIAIKLIYQGSSNFDASWKFVTCEEVTESSADDFSWIKSNGSHRRIDLMEANIFLLIRNMISFYYFAKSNQIDIIHVHHRRLALVCGIVSRILRIPLVYTGQLTYDHHPLFDISASDVGVAISESVRLNMAATTKMRDIVVISNPAAMDASPRDIPQSAYNTIGCIARLDEVKNHSTLLDAWYIFYQKNPSFKLLLLGEGILLDSLQDKVRRLGLGDSVEFVGFLSDVSPFIERCSFLILPSWKEGQGIVTLEGAGKGRASLLTDVDGSRDCVPPNSVLPNKINPASAVDLAAAIQFWSENPQAVAEEGRIFHSYWLEKAQPQSVAREYRMIYEKAIKSFH